MAKPLLVKESKSYNLISLASLPKIACLLPQKLSDAWGALDKEF